MTKKPTYEELEDRLQHLESLLSFTQKTNFFLSATILDEIPAFIYLQAPDYSIPYANRYFIEQFGELSPDIPCFQQLWGRDKPCEDCKTFKVFDTKKPQSWEWDKTPNGRVYQINDYPFTDENGNRFVLELGIDITEQKTLEAKVKEANERYRSIFTDNHSVLLLIEPNSGRICEANPQACHFYGYEYDQLCQMHISDINILSQNEIKKEMERASKAERKQFFFKHKLASGEIRDVEVYSGPVTMNKTPLLFSIIHDITAQIQAEEALRRAEKQERLLLHAVSEGIYGLDLDGNTIFVNPAAEQMLGYSKNELIGKSSHKLIHHSYANGSAYPEKECKMIASINEKKKIQVSDEVLWRKDGTCFPVEYTSTPVIKRDQVVGAVVAFSDITDRITLEQERENLIAELTEALENVKQLKGFLPICASCKKIRDDKGYWNQIESYIALHSEAEFSHGICPDCVKVLYPELEILADGSFKVIDEDKGNNSP